mgnify:CR=1 FL=1
MQQGRNNNGIPYDQNREPLRTSAPSQRNEDSSAEKNSGYGYNGEPLSRPPSRTAGGAVRHSRTDNSIPFPVQPQAPRPAPRQTGSSTMQYPTRQRSGSAHRPQQTARSAGSGKRRPARSVSGNAARPQAQSRSRTVRNVPKQNQQGAQQRYQNQRLRPAAQMHDPARREVRKKRKVTRATLRRRRMMRRLMAFAMLLCVIGAGIYLTMTMLFRIGTIRVQTADGAPVTEIAGYSADNILQVLGVQLEQNIFSFEPTAKEAVLEQRFPLLESIKVIRDYPSTVVVQVTEATPTYVVQSGKQWLIISDTMKILTAEDTLPEGLCTLYGGEVQDATPGVQLSFVETTDTASSAASAASSETAGAAEVETKLEILNELRSKLEEYELLGDVTRMEFADPEEIAFLYQDRISVLLGTSNDLDYKLDRARYVLTDADGKGCGPTDTGRLDFSHTSAGSTRKIYFAQGEPILPSGYVVPQKIVDTAADAESTDGTDLVTVDPGMVQPTDVVEEVPLTDPARMTANVDEDPM